MKNLIIASTSTLYNQGYLEYLTPILQDFLKDVSELVFIPYAKPGGICYDTYTEIVQQALTPLNIKVKGLHSFTNPIQALKTAEAIFTGGGNTFLLVHTLYKKELMQPLRDAILQGVPYLGTSAGSNITGLTMQNTNDMPIIHPPSFKTLGILPFNINPHYLDPVQGLKHMGETRATRIQEFHSISNVPVLGLREGSYLRVIKDTITLEGVHTARVFSVGKNPYEITPGTIIDLK